MKKAKKLLSVFLAALMVMTTLGGVMMASAASQTDAEAAVAAYVKGEVTYPTSNGKKTAETAEETLNSLLSAIIEKQALKNTIYSDATVNTILNALYSLIKYSPASIASGISSKYQAVKDYLNKVEDTSENAWANGNVDTTKMVWGITPGDKDAFIDALANGMGTLGLTATMLLSKDYGAGYYDSAIAPLFESLHVTPISSASYDEIIFNVAFMGAGSMSELATPIVTPLVAFIEQVLGNPLDTLCTVLPDFAFNYAANMSSLQGLLSGLGVKLDLTDLDALLNSVLESTGITLPDIDLAYLGSLGTAYVADSITDGGKRLAIDGDKADVFMAVMQYVGEALKIEGNQNTIIKLLGDQLGNGYGDEIVAVVDAARHGTSLDIADASVSLCESIAENLGIKTGNEGIGGFFAKVMNFFNRIARAIVDLFKTFGGKVAA